MNCASPGSWIRATHRYGFRSGEWAHLRGTTTLPVGPHGTDREVYLVEFGDGVTDFWPVTDPDEPYEFAAVAGDRGGTRKDTPA